MKSFVACDVAGRRARGAMGSNRSAQADGWMGAGCCSEAVVFGVAMVRVKVLVVAPGGRVGGLKEAVARLGRPVAARVMGLESVAP